MQDARFSCVAKNVRRANATTAEQQAVSEALSKFKKQRKKKYFITREEALTEFRLSPMLALKWADHKSKAVFPTDVQPKYDGLRCLAYRRDGEIVLQSRGGDPYKVPHIAAELEELGDEMEDIILDGELYCHGVSLQTLSSWIKRLQEDTANIEYHVYDRTREDDELPWGQRNLLLADWFKRNKPRLEMVHYVESIQCDSEEDVKQAHDMFVHQGYEGAIIRLSHGLYRFGYRSAELLKLKEFEDGEFCILDWKVGKGKFAGVPIFHCVTKDGKEFDVAPKGSTLVRAQMLRDANKLVGQMLTVRYFDLTDDGVPHFPVGVAIRSKTDL